MITTIIKPVKQKCEVGCPVDFYRIMREGWDSLCSNGGQLTEYCTDPHRINVEIQPHDRADGGESVECKVNGLNVRAEHEFWYCPVDDIHLTTPGSNFQIESFDSTLFYGGWSVIRYLGSDWIVTHLKNWLGSCPGEDCDIITLQTGLLVPFKSCISRVDTSSIPDDEYSVTDEWIRA